MKEEVEKTVDYKGYTITVYKNKGGMYTAKNDSGEPYMDVPQFKTPEKAITWDKKNIDQMTENTNVIEIKEEVTIVQEDGTKVILEKGDKVEVLDEAMGRGSLLRHELEDLLIEFLADTDISVDTIQGIGMAIRDAFSIVFNEADYRDAIALINNITNSRNRGVSTSYEGSKIQ